MGLGDRIENAAENVGGKAKEAFGKLTDNDRLQAEGEFQQAEAEAKEFGEDAKDKLGEFADNFDSDRPNA